MPIEADGVRYSHSQQVGFGVHAMVRPEPGIGGLIGPVVLSELLIIRECEPLYVQ
jgi:hypothetical protein